VDVLKVPPLSAVDQLSEVLDSPEIAALVSELEATRWTGRPGYPLRSLVGMALVKSVYAIPTWTRTVALVREHEALRAAIASTREVPSVYACYRFTAKLRAYSHLLDACLDRVTAGLSAQLPEYGRNIAIDGSDMPAYANGQRFVSNGGRERADSEFSDPDALMGPPLRSQHPQGRRLLRLQARPRRLHRDRPAARVECADRPRSRGHSRPAPDRQGTRARVRSRDVRGGQGL
jgi:hypothetical protein